MKALIASDIHGAIKYLNKLEEIITKEKIDKIILLGDLLKYSFDENKDIVIEKLNKYKDKIIAVRGNCDSKVDEKLYHFDISSDYREIYLDDNKFILTHGHLNSWLIDIIKDNIVLQGHTHIYNLDGQYINPGSVGLPREYKENTSIIYENNELKLIDLDSFETIQIRKLK
jgi:putative phosphoesterase